MMSRCLSQYTRWVWGGGCVGAWVSEGSTEYDVKILITKKPGGCGGVGWGVYGCVGERGID